MANAIPVFPLVASSKVLPGPSRPAAMDLRTMATAGRSLTLPPGLCHSALPSSVIPGGARTTRSRRTSGVLPIWLSSGEPSSISPHSVRIRSHQHIFLRDESKTTNPCTGRSTILRAQSYSYRGLASLSEVCRGGRGLRGRRALASRCLTRQDKPARSNNNSRCKTNASICCMKSKEDWSISWVDLCPNAVVCPHKRNKMIIHCADLRAEK